MLHLEQRSYTKRLLICIPLFLLGYWITTVDFDVVWRYFAWTNQTLATIVLWTVTVYLFRRGSNHWVALVPAVAMTYVCSSFLFVSDQFFGMEQRTAAYLLGGALTVLLSLAIYLPMRRRNPAEKY